MYSYFSTLQLFPFFENVQNRKLVVFTGFDHLLLIFLLVINQKVCLGDRDEHFVKPTKSHA